MADSAPISTATAIAPLGTLFPHGLTGLAEVTFYERLTEGLYSPWQKVNHSFKAHDQQPPVLMKQIHSATIKEIHSPGDAESRCEADGIICSVAGLRIGVVTADCVPVLIAGDLHVAALHCGWRGIQRGLLGRCLERLVALGEQPGNLQLLTGPFIQPGAFEVGPEVIEAFVDRPHATALEAEPWLTALRLATSKGREDRWHLDMGLIIAAIALSHGLTPAHIAISRECTKTAHNGDHRWPSYRRSGKSCGRIVSAIAHRS